MKQVYVLTEEELLKHDENLIQKTANTVIKKALEELGVQSQIPEWVSPKWIYETGYCGIKSSSTYQQVKNQIQAEVPVNDWHKYFQGDERITKVNTSSFNQWVETKRQHDKETRSLDIRQQMGVV